jgi:hypothetical protein
MATTGTTHAHSPHRLTKCNVGSSGEALKGYRKNVNSMLARGFSFFGCSAKTKTQWFYFRCSKKSGSKIFQAFLSQPVPTRRALATIWAHDSYDTTRQAHFGGRLRAQGEAETPVPHYPRSYPPTITDEGAAMAGFHLTHTITICGGDSPAPLYNYTPSSESPMLRK